jgi:hypothetical protein
MHSHENKTHPSFVFKGIEINSLPRKRETERDRNFKGTKLPAIKTHAAQCILVVVHNSISPLNPHLQYTVYWETIRFQKS